MLFKRYTAISKNRNLTSNMQYSVRCTIWLFPQEDIKSWITPLTWARLVQIGKKYGNDPKKPPEQGDVVKIDVTSREKEERTKLHQYIRAIWPHLITSTTDETDESKKFISVSYKLKKQQDFPRERKEKFLHFTLFKEFWDTSYLFGQLYKILGVERERHTYSFAVAGTKDKRGLTTQRVSIKCVLADRLKRAVNKLNAFKPHNRDSTQQRVEIGDFEYKTEPIQLGDLNGNRFTIVLRNISLDQGVDSALQSLRDNGFINYYGLQVWPITLFFQLDFFGHW